MIIDLTMPLDEKTPVFPGDPLHEIRQIATLSERGWNEKRLTFNSHFGTHIDAPFHMLADGKKLKDFDVDSFVGAATVVNLGGSVLDLSMVMGGDIVFFYTGHTAKVGTPIFYKDNPVLTIGIAHTLIEKKVKMVGIDSFTVDNAPFEAHKLLLAHDILIVENLVNLRSLIGKRFMCYALPIALQEDGGPCRVIGVT